MASQPNALLTAEEYLDLEEKAEYKSEYIDGEIFAMSGVSPDHDTIVVNLNGILYNQLKGTPCRTHTSDLRVAASPTSAYTYPDVSISCKDPRFIHRGTSNLLNPVAIIEVLSPSTEVYDRGKKFLKYQQIESLQEYVLVSQDKVLMERYARQSNDEWLYGAASNLGDSVGLASAPATLRLSDVYEGVFPAHADNH